eukprot:Skav208464  [mRNA]  locus=scaffold1104:237186:238561:- [translate_table: standard]
MTSHSFSNKFFISRTRSRLTFATFSPSTGNTSKAKEKVSISRGGAALRSPQASSTAFTQEVTQSCAPGPAGVNVTEVQSARSNRIGQ